MNARQPLLFDPADIPQTEIPSVEYQQAMLLRGIEAIRFDPEKLADYTRKYGISGRDFLDHVIWWLGGRSQ
jgi:hypothetical protein